MQNQEKWYIFDKFPENIRQIGEQPEERRIYIEDYVATYLQQIFQKSQNDTLAILLGKEGNQETAGTSFIYGAIKVDLDIIDKETFITSEKWDVIYKEIHEHFSGAKILGWACGIEGWNSQFEERIRDLQKHFHEEDSILFLKDMCEKEEKIFRQKAQKLVELPGYVIFYSKNPQMQEYVLENNDSKSFEANYDDSVMRNVRKVIKKNEEQSTKKMAYGSIGVVLLLIMVVGMNILFQNNKKAAHLEEAVKTLSESEKKVQVSQFPQSTKLGNTSSKKVSSLNAVSKDTSSKKAVSKDTRFTKKHQKTEKKTSPIKTKKRKKETIACNAAVKSKKKKMTGNKVEIKKEKKRNNLRAYRKKSSYVVGKGDTLSQIVWRQYHDLKCMKMVKKANHIKDRDEIKKGQRIILPAYKK